VTKFFKFIELTGDPWLAQRTCYSTPHFGHLPDVFSIEDAEIIRQVIKNYVFTSTIPRPEIIDQKHI
jgi:hypothetical protein